MNVLTRPEINKNHTLSNNCRIEWNDYKLKWNPDDYGGVDTLHVPSEHIWLPDISSHLTQVYTYFNEVFILIIALIRLKLELAMDEYS
uniref:CSON014828 protein n=1 Tax=Culicoides sonorensis TaxID=179676 RepID=A0A336KSR6_CULSO